MGLLLPGSSDAADVVASYDRYDDFARRVAKLGESELVSVQKLGASREGRDLLLLTIGEAQPHRPSVLVVGGVQASHLAGGELALRIAEYLVEHAGEESVQDLLRRVTLHVIPRPNPDAVERAFHTPRWERDTNSRPTDDDRDGKLDEDPPEDLNGDGLITQMRIEDPTGEYLPHEDEPRLLVKADPKKNQRGRYRVLTEGVDNDKDQQWNEDPPGGVDFNKNFPFHYPYFAAGAGPHAVSEPESRAVADFAFSQPHLLAVFTFAPQDNLFHPWKSGGKPSPGKVSPTLRGGDVAYANHLAEIYRKLHGGKNAPPSSKEIRGSFVHWSHMHFGRWSLATRGWWPPKVEEKAKSDSDEKGSNEEGEAEESAEAGSKDDKSTKPDPKKKPDAAKKPAAKGPDSSELRALRWLDHEKIAGFTDWTEIDHPDFPDQKVEVGGFHPYVQWNPPAEQLKPLVEKQVKFLGKFSELLPRLTLAQPRVESLGEGIYRVSVKVLNNGYLPTDSEMGAASQHTYPPQVELLLPDDAELLTGHKRHKVGRLAGLGGAEEFRWLVKTSAKQKQTITIKTWSPTAGSAAAKIDLPATK